MKSSTIMCGFAGLLLLLAIGALCAALVLPHWVTDGGGHVNTTGLFSNCSVSDWSDDCNKNFDVDSILDDPRESKMTSLHGKLVLHHFYCLMQDCSNSGVLSMAVLQSCRNYRAFSWSLFWGIYNVLLLIGWQFVTFVDFFLFTVLYF